MKRLLGLICLAVTCPVFGQVQVTEELRLSGSQGANAIIGLADPATHDAAITVSGSVKTGGYTWCTGTVSGDTIVLSSAPGIVGYTDGQVVRFASPTALQGTRFLKSAGLAALPVVRPDGLPLTPGQIPSGYVVEAVKAGDRFFVMSTLNSGCPPGFIQAHENLCIEAQSVPNQLFKQGVERCAKLGGKLCNWDEYIAACTLVQGQLTGMFVDWEWIDDSSNHGHGADQAGRFTCVSQRHWGLLPVTPYRSRCCFNP
ncbi:MAG: hypothetical protein IPJ85_18330 [Flavobacteriales bacterium]|nr:hypothetical protein [Flavobacteriales bacterium]